MGRLPNGNYTVYATCVNTPDKDHRYAKALRILVAVSKRLSFTSECERREEHEDSTGSIRAADNLKAGASVSASGVQDHTIAQS